MSRGPVSRSRELGTAALACAAGAAVVLIATGRDWVTARAVQGDLRAPVEVSGSSLAPVTSALALAALAGAAAIVATRGVARGLAGLVLLGCGLGAAAAAALAAADPGDDVAQLAGDVLGAGTANVEQQSVSAWPWVAVAGAAAIALAGAATLLRGAAWPAMGSRYEAPVGTAPAPAAPVARDGTPLEQWRALDRGEDPTADRGPD